MSFSKIRNHPCVFDYTMDNEDVSLNIAKDLYATAKQLDPSRPVNTADGIWGATAVLPNPQVKMMNFVLKTRSFVSKTMDLVFKNEELCIKNKDLCIKKNAECCRILRTFEAAHLR